MVRGLIEKEFKMKKKLFHVTVEDFFNGPNRALLTVIREDTGERVLVSSFLVEYISADRVKILVPGKVGYGRVVPENPQAN